MSSTSASPRLADHEAFRDSFQKSSPRQAKITAPKMFKDVQGKSLSQEIEQCAAMSSAIYDNSEDFGEIVASKAFLKVRQAGMELPPYEGASCIESACVPIGGGREIYHGCRMGVVTVVVRRQGQLCQELYLSWKGSDPEEILDWVSNLDFLPTRTKVEDLLVMSGTHSAWNSCEGVIESHIQQAMQSGSLPRVFFTGHSRGGGIALLAHLQCWKKFPELRNSMYCIVFSAPPVFYFEDNSHERTAGIREKVRQLSVNIFAEFDIVPWFNQPFFRDGALRSCTPSWLQFLRVWAVAGRVGRIVEKPSELQDSHLRKFEHIANLCVATSRWERCDVTGKPVAFWNWVFAASPREKAQIFMKHWPFPGEKTQLAVSDHIWMPHCISPQWPSCMCFEDQDSESGKDPNRCRSTIAQCSYVEEMFHDCWACKRSWCTTCGSDSHKHVCSKEWSSKRRRFDISSFCSLDESTATSIFGAAESDESIEAKVNEAAGMWDRAMYYLDALFLLGFYGSGFGDMSKTVLTREAVEELFQATSERHSSAAQAKKKGLSAQAQAVHELWGERLLADCRYARALLLRMVGRKTDFFGDVTFLHGAWQLEQEKKHHILPPSRDARIKALWRGLESRSGFEGD